MTAYWLGTYEGPGLVVPPDREPGWHPVAMSQGLTTNGPYGTMIISILWAREEMP